MALGVGGDLAVKHYKHGAERPLFFFVFFPTNLFTFDTLEHRMHISSEGMRAPS